LHPDNSNHALYFDSTALITVFNMRTDLLNLREKLRWIYPNRL